MERDRAIADVRSFGEAALLVILADEPGREASRRVHAVAAAVEAAGVSGVRSATPGLTSVLVEFDPLAVERTAVGAAIREAEAAAAEVASTPRHRLIPVVYGGEHGPDLADVAELTGLAPDEVVRQHAATSLEVYLLGFSPGFPYLGELPSALHVPRLATPRTRTPAGSVAITGRYSGIYPMAAPGGWRVIGRTPVRLFDPVRTPPAYLLPGDTVEFKRIQAEEFDAVPAFASDW